MAEDILDDPGDDLDDDVMDDDLKYALEDSVDETQAMGKKEALFARIKKIPKLMFGSKKAILILAVSFILLIIFALGVWMLFLKAGPEDIQDPAGSTSTRQDLKDTLDRKDQVIFEDIIDLEPFERIQLKPGSSMGLISLTLSLELIDHRDRKLIFSLKERIRTIIKEQVKEMTWLELKNPEGKIMLKYNLLKRMNSIFPKTVIRDIYFITFIMQ